MRLPRLFGKPSPPPATPTPPPATVRRFAVDRARMFDLELTGKLSTLFAVPADNRDDAWLESFFDTVWNASLEVAKPPAFKGPDGFGYLRLQIPSAGAFDSNALANYAATCVARTTGAAIFASPDATAPEYVLSMGMLDSLLRYDSWRGDPQDVAEIDRPSPHPDTIVRKGPNGAEQLTLTGEHQVLLGTPSADYLPPHAARALLRHLTEIWQLPEPRVQLMMNAQTTPTRSLIINRRLADFPTPERAAAQCQMLLWYLPPRRNITLLPEGWNETGMTKLSDLAQSAAT